MRIAMIGTGYVGLVSGACIADFGHEVTCVDKDAAKIASLGAGEVPIYEPGLKDLVQSNARRKSLSFTTELAEALAGAEAVFIAVGTPSRRGDGHADLSYVYDATREIAALLTDLEVVVVSNPEFLREGAAIHDFKHPDRIVVGTDDERAKRIVTEIYRPLYLNRALIKTAQDQDVSLRILEAVEATNEIRKRAMARKVTPAFSGVLRNKTVAVLGLTFKPNTDDMREAPSIPLIMALQDRGAKVRVYDPAGMEQAKPVLPDIDYCTGPYDCVTDADAAVIVTEWEQFRALDLKRMRDLMACPVVVDLRNIYQPEEMHSMGFAYSCVGRTSALTDASPSISVARRAAAQPNTGARDEMAAE